MDIHVVIINDVQCDYLSCVKISAYICCCVCNADIILGIIGYDYDYD